MASKSVQPALKQEDIVQRLERYDIRRNPRLVSLYTNNQPHTRRCAVLVPLFFSSVDQQLQVLLTLRASTLRSHASVVAFPGGAQDASDTDDAFTALREAQEEVGLDPADVTVVAHLPPSFVRLNNSVYPVVGLIPSHFQPRLNPEEVEMVFTVPLKNFLDKDIAYSSWEFHGQQFRVPFLTHVVGDSPLNVWGFTCYVCIGLAHAVLGPFKRFRLVVKDNRKTKEGTTDQNDDDDDNVFGDMEIMYQLLCKASQPRTAL